MKDIMIEDLLADLNKPIKAIHLLTIFLEEQLYDEVIYNINKNQRNKNENTLAINYAIQLINKDLLKIKRRYYKLMCKEKYEK
ncbi:MAG: hypothetical protein IJW73_05620 [Candidatus Gastranaerophilales bacterium]|nr:hypothetical protein [Candidatus Gastranaerophilales bacterium]